MGGAEFLLLITLLGAGLYWGLVKLCQEGKMLALQLPIWVEQFDLWLTGSCREMEQTFGLREGRVADVVSEMLTNLIQAGKQSAMPALMANSVTVIRWGVGITVVFVVLFLAVVLSLQEMDDLRVRRDLSVFRREFAMIGKRIVHTGKAWFKTQGIILSLITMPVSYTHLDVYKRQESVYSPAKEPSGLRVRVVRHAPAPLRNSISTGWFKGRESVFTGTAGV